MDSSLLACLIRVCWPASITERGRVVALRLSGVFTETGFTHTTLEAQLTMGICSLDGQQARVAPLKLCFFPPTYSGSSLLVAGVQRTSSWCPSSASCRDMAIGPLISAAWLGYQSRWHLLLFCFRPVSARSPPGLWPGTHSHPYLILVFTHLLFLRNTHWLGPFASEKDEGWVLCSSPI